MSGDYGDVAFCGERFGDQVLVCPTCGFEYLDHSGVVVYDRQEDEPSGLCVVIGAGRISTRRSLDGNPSYRRHGIAIRFSCEGCDLDAELTIAQEKGHTFFRWRDPVAEAPYWPGETAETP